MALAARERPLSPFLHYRWMFTNTLSILHRISGLALAAAMFLLVYWLVAAASGPEHYDRALTLLGAWPAQVLLFLATLAFAYHLLNGIRHLFFDMGRGFELATARKSARFVAIGAVVLALVVWFVLRRSLGGVA
jgi:succinate dehydrogenase / fumarate reductase, cytochrome b subunit